MPTFGKVDEYNENEEWRHYVERLNHFYEANEITDEAKQRSIFLVSVGAKTYKLIRSLVAPRDPKEKSYVELAKLVQDHYKPKPSVIVERFKFNTRCQQQGENISVFLAELRRLSENCEFGATLDEMLRDRLVCGARDNKIQRRLLAEPKLTLKRALDLAIAIETSEKDVLDLQNSMAQGGSLVNKLEAAAKDPKGHEAVKCSRCDGKHYSSECRFKEAKCHACGKVGHISRACRSKEQGKQKSGGQPQRSWQQKPSLKHISEEEKSSSGSEQRNANL